MTTNEPLYLVTGATGKTGDRTVRLLLDRGHRVRAFVHRADQRSAKLAATGAEVAVGDLLDFGSVSAAMPGVTNAYFCYQILPGLLEATAIFAQAASEAGVTSVVNMSQISARREAESNAARQHWLAERLLDRTAMRTAHLRPTLFAEWLVAFFNREGGEGVLRLPFADARHAPIVGADQASVIAAVLEHPEPHDRQVYPLYGPVEMNHHEIAAAMSRSLGIPVRYEPISVETFTAALTAMGANPYLVQHLGHIAVDYRNGVFAGTNNLVEVVGGQAPTGIERFVAARPEAFSTSGVNAIPATVPV
ncbi:NmrA family NAD(P)-binding protein [Dactylosporangium sp. NPDC005572]|uniref:NmrA family NAD(P)-binding protein n=1 Tax=Dactylosporangium sp. NPDC005572 TaxID=3156889 RepID=UPI0033B6B996